MSPFLCTLRNPLTCCVILFNGSNLGEFWVWCLPQFSMWILEEPCFALKIFACPQYSCWKTWISYWKSLYFSAGNLRKVFEPLEFGLISAACFLKVLTDLGNKVLLTTHWKEIRCFSIHNVNKCTWWSLDAGSTTLAVKSTSQGASPANIQGSLGTLLTSRVLSWNFCFHMHSLRR